MIFSHFADHPVYAYTGGKPFDAKHPTVVLIHGAQNDHSVWALQSRYLAHHGYGVLALDLPGHGRTLAPPLPSISAMSAWVLSLLDHLSIHKAHWIGHSMGSLIALDVAGMFPDRALSLSLIGTAFPMRVSDALLQAIKDDEHKAQMMVNQWSHSTWAAKPSSPGPGSWTYGQGLRLMEHITRLRPGVMYSDFVACNQYQDGLLRAANVQCPSLIIQGAQDSMTSPKGLSALQSALPKLETVIVQACGHATMAEQPDVVLDTLRGFLSHASPAMA